MRYLFSTILDYLFNFQKRLKELGEDLGSEDEDDEEDGDDDGNEGEESEESDGSGEEDTLGEEIHDNTEQSNEEKLDQNEKEQETLNSNEDLNTQDLPEEQNGIENVNRDNIGTCEDTKEPSEEVLIPSGIVENGVCESMQPGEGLGDESDVNVAHTEESPEYEVNHEQLGDTEEQFEGKTVQEGVLEDEKGVESTEE